MDKFRNAYHQRESLPLSPTIPVDYYSHVSASEHLRDKGCAAFPGMVNTDLLDGLKMAMDIRKSDPGDETADPLFNYSICRELAFDDFVIHVASEFFGVMPAIGSAHLISEYSLKSDEEEFYRSSYRNSIRLLTVLFHLDDVGHLDYVPESDSKKFPGWEEKEKWTYREINEIYGDPISIEAKKGDLMALSATGWNNWLKMNEKPKDLLVVHFSIEKENNSLGKTRHSSSWTKIPKEFAEFLPKWKQPLCDFLVKV
jgi:hypothetical protein